MNTFETEIIWCGVAFELEVTYERGDENELEIERADMIGVYMPGDNVQKRDYTSLGVNIPLQASEMPGWVYDELMIDLELHLLNQEKDDDYEA